MFQMLPEAWLKLTPFPQNQMLVCPQPTIRDLKKDQNKLSVYIFYHPSTAIRKRPLHPFISFTIHPPIVILKTAITSIHLIHHPSTTILKRLLHPSISFTINPSKIQKNHNFFYFFEISSIHCNL